VQSFTNPSSTMSGQPTGSRLDNLERGKPPLNGSEPKSSQSNLPANGGEKQKQQQENSSRISSTDWASQVPEDATRGRNARRPIIPKDLSKYPGFPETDGLPENEADAAIINFWKIYRRPYRAERNKLRQKRQLQNQTERSTQAEKRRLELSQGSSSRGPPSKRVDTKKTPVRPVNGKGSLPPQQKPRIPTPGVSYADATAKKSYPYIVHVHGGQKDKDRISQKDFVEVAGRLNQAWVQSPIEEVKLRIDGTKWVNGRKHILCLDEATRKWVKSQLKTLVVNGRTFRGWDMDEYLDMAAASVHLVDVYDKCNPHEIITRSLRELKLEGDVVVKSIIPTGNGRIVKLLLHTGLAEAVARMDSRIPAGLSHLVFKFKPSKPEDPEEEPEVTEMDTDTPKVDVGTNKAPQGTEEAKKLSSSNGS
jgi:hypothetical protein